ncbi:MAG: type II toxin-antitoxin system VapC family toxin [Bryobacterales bacterium]|nr:type II toxin-antitoxin system VapC family toxin [Bryobacterales bacterium]
MVAVDTNVIVRLLTADDPAQTALAKALFNAEEIWIAKTVVLETAWVLRTVFEFEEVEVAEALFKLICLDNVIAEDEDAITSALRLVDKGVELADALHLFSHPPGTRFVSFDKAFVQRAKRAGVEGISRLGG